MIHPLRMAMIATLVAAAPLFAVDVPRTDDPLAARTLALAPVDPQFDAAATAAYLASVPWQEWNRGHGGQWTAQLDTLTGVPRRVYGGAIPWISGAANDLDGVPPSELERVARAFIDANRSLFGAGNEQLRFVPEAAAPTASGRMHYAAFDFVVNGVPVEHGRLVFAVNNGNLIYWHSANIAAVPAVTTPVVSAAAARQALLAHAGTGGLTPAQEPVLKLLPRNTATGGRLHYRLVFEVALRRAGDDTSWAGLVDALTGAVLAFGDSTRHLACPETRSSSPGQVDGGVRRALATDGEVVRPLPSLHVTTGQGQTTTGANGVFPFSGGSASSALAGSFVRIECADCVKSADDPQAGFQPFVTAFGSGRLSFGTGGGDLVQGAGLPTISYANGTSTPAARSAFYNVNAAHALVRKWLAVPWLSEQTEVRVNFSDVCNARWDGTRLTYFKAGVLTSGVRCSNSGEIRDVVQHEWAHVLDDFDGRRPGYALGHGDMATGEGMADLVAFFGDHDACIGHSLFPDLNGPAAGSFVSDPDTTAVSRCGGVRNIDEHRGSRGVLTASNVRDKCPQGAIRNTSGGLLPNEVLIGPFLRLAHCEGEMYGQAGHHLAQNLLTGRAYGTVTLDANRQFATHPGDPLPPAPDGSPNPALERELAWTVHERMFYESRPLVGSYAPSRYQAIGPSAYDGYLVVDDEGDGLANGTPHAAYVNDAFAHHGLEEWLVPGTPSVPDAANCAPLPTPAVNVAASIDGGSGLPEATVSWSGVPGAARYTVLRAEERHEPFVPLATVDAAARSLRDAGVRNGVTYFYRVEAGDASMCDRRSPAGVATLQVALGDPRFRSVTVTDTPLGNNDGALDPGERAQLFVVLGNEGPAALTNVRATLQALTPGVTVKKGGPYAYGTMAAGGAAGPDQPFVIALESSRALCGVPVELRMAISSDQGCFTETVVLPSGSDASGCNIRNAVELHASAVLTDDRLNANCGDGDGIADPGETVAVTVSVANAGEQPAHDVVVALATDEPYLTVAGPGSFAVGSVDGSNRQTKHVTFALTVAANAPFDDPAALTVTLSASNAGPATALATIRVNRDVVEVDRDHHFETGDEGWTSSDPAGGWQRTTGPSTDGTLSTVWHSRYRSSQCDFLLSPVWELGDAPSASFSAAWTTEPDFDGMDVQISIDGGATWHTVHPAGGYPGLASAGGCIPRSSPLFSGAAPVAETFTIDLSEYAGTTAQLRFRMSSDISVEAGAGAWVDEVTIRDVKAIAPDGGCGAP